MISTETSNMASFTKSTSGCLPERGNDVKDSDSPPVVKKKLCRVSNGRANTHRSLLVLSTKKDTVSEKRASYTFSEGIAREIGGGDHLVEICVVRGSVPPCQHLAEAGQHTEDSQQHGVMDRNGNLLENETDGRIRRRPADSDEDLSSNDAKSPTKRRVAFSDNVTIHNFETEDDNISSDMDCASVDENFPDDNLRNENKNHVLSVETNDDTNASLTHTIALPFYSKKMPLRRVILNQVTRACSTANLLRTLLRESFRKTNSNQHRARTPLARSRSLPESSVRHSFIGADDNNGAAVQLVIALGQHFAPNNISVKTSGDGKKIKVLASLKRSATDHVKWDYQEWFYLPKPIDPRETKATVDYEGFLKIEAPFIVSSPLNSWTQ